MSSCALSDNNTKLKTILNQCSLQHKSNLQAVSNEASDDKVFPLTAYQGKLKLVSASEWTSGFYPGIFWKLYDQLQDDFWKKKAMEYTALINEGDSVKFSINSGVSYLSSYGNGYRITNNAHYKNSLLKAADKLASQYNSQVGAICFSKSELSDSQVSVSVESLSSVELLLWASKHTNNKHYRDIAVQHANTVQQHHFRENGSTWQIVDYDSETGDIQRKYTLGGYNDSTVWSRSQAWGLYGCIMTYRETKIPRFLEQAEKLARFVVHHPRLPENKIPYWDFDAPGIPLEPRDAVSAAIVASALIELSDYSQERMLFFSVANEIISSLSTSHYRAFDGDNYGFILKHSVYDISNEEKKDVPLVHADYYFLEAMERKIKYDSKPKNEI